MQYNNIITIHMVLIGFCVFMYFDIFHLAHYKQILSDCGHPADPKQSAFSSSERGPPQMPFDKTATRSYYYKSYERTSSSWHSTFFRIHLS